MIGKAVGLFVFALLTFGVFVVGVVTLYWAGDVWAEPIRDGSSTLDMARVTFVVLFGFFGVLGTTAVFGVIFWGILKTVSGTEEDDKDISETSLRGWAIAALEGVGSPAEEESQSDYRKRQVDAVATVLGVTFDKHGQRMLFALGLEACGADIDGGRCDRMPHDDDEHVKLANQ